MNMLVGDLMHLQHEQKTTTLSSRSHLAKFTLELVLVSAAINF